MNPINPINRKHIKIIISGCSGVGKTSLVDYYINRQTINYNPITIGVDFSTKLVEKNGKQYKLHIFDTAGLEKFRSITKNYYVGAMCALVCFSLENIRSFNNLDSFLKDIHELCDINVYVVLVGTHSDSKNKEITIEMINKLITKNSISYFEVSSANGDNIDNLFEHIIDETIERYPYATVDNKNNNIIPINKNNKDCCNLL